MRTYLLLFNLCIISIVQAQIKLEQEKAIIFSDFEKYGYTLTVYIKDNVYVETKLSGECKIANNTEDAIIRYITALTSNTVAGVDREAKLLPQDTAVFYFVLHRPFAKAMRRDEPIIANSLDAQTYDVWNKDTLFDYLKKSDRYYRIRLEVRYDSGSIDSFSMDFLIPVNSIKEIIWIDNRKK